MSVDSFLCKQLAELENDVATIRPNISPHVELPLEALADFCRRWQIDRLSLFGSALREEFSADSDLDFLAQFAPDSKWTLWDQVRMEEELADLTGRSVDLVDRVAVEESRNWIRRREILETARDVYVSG